METINAGIPAGMRSNAPPAVTRLPTAFDIMVTEVVTLRPTDTIRDAIRTLLSARISGAPVVNEDSELVGMLSEMDCLRVIASGAYDAEPFERARQVCDLMSVELTTIEPTMDLYAIAHLFLTKHRRRLPVVEGRRVIGQVSRRDVLRAVEREL
jgi:CBS domain-containing protein